jgi:hypothetical protein
MPAMYTPANLRAVTDFSEFYEKPPHEMSRYELQELEKILRIEDGLEEAEQVEEEGDINEKMEKFKKSDYYHNLRG